MSGHMHPDELNEQQTHEAKLCRAETCMFCQRDEALRAQRLQLENAERDLKALRDQFKVWKGGHLYDGPDCIFCGHFGPADDPDEPCTCIPFSRDELKLKLRETRRLERDHILTALVRHTDAGPGIKKFIEDLPEAEDVVGNEGLDNTSEAQKARDKEWREALVKELKVGGAISMDADAWVKEAPTYPERWARIARLACEGLPAVDLKAYAHHIKIVHLPEPKP